MKQKLEVIEGEVYATPFNNENVADFEAVGIYEYVAISEDKATLYLGSIDDNKGAESLKSSPTELKVVENIDFFSFKEIIHIASGKKILLQH